MATLIRLASAAGVILSVLLCSACSSKPEPSVPVAELLNSPLLIMYHNPRCPHCSRARAWLDQRGITYELRNVQQPDYKREFLALGGRGVPFFVLRGKRVEGFSPPQLETLLASAYQPIGNSLTD